MRYFESIGEYGNAVSLYQAANETQRAITICFKSQLFKELSSICNMLLGLSFWLRCGRFWGFLFPPSYFVVLWVDLELSKIEDPKIIQKCAEFFLKHGHFDKAVNMCVATNQQQKALELCYRHNVEMTDELVQKLTPPKTRNKLEKEQRKKVC